MSIDLFLQLTGTVFFGLAAFNTHIPHTNSLGIGAALWAISFLAF